MISHAHCFVDETSADMLFHNERVLDAIKVDALYSYRRYLHDHNWDFYPPADPDELKRCKAAQKAKRDARRVRVSRGDLDGVLDEMLNDIAEA